MNRDDKERIVITAHDIGEIPQDILAGFAQWKPDDEEARLLTTLSRMVAECLAGQGTDTRKTFVSNLRAVIDGLEKLPKRAEGLT